MSDAAALPLTDGELDEVRDDLRNGASCVAARVVRGLLARLEAAEAERERLIELRERLGQTLAALPDATANGAANLAHARAERDRLAAENQRLHEGLGYQASIVARVEGVADWGLPVYPEVLRLVLDPAQSLQCAEGAAHAAAEGNPEP